MKTMVLSIWADFELITWWLSVPWESELVLLWWAVVMWWLELVYAWEAWKHALW